MGTTFCFAILIIIIIGALVVLGRGRAEADKARRAAYTAYQEGLSLLKANPNDPNLKQRVLQLGRAYSELTRADKKVTLFDEIALQNDLSAATAGATQSISTPVISQTKTPEERLSHLEQLRTKGLITEQEYTERRQQILGEV